MDLHNLLVFQDLFNDDVLEISRKLFLEKI